MAESDGNVDICPEEQEPSKDKQLHIRDGQQYPTCPLSETVIRRKDVVTMHLSRHDEDVSNGYSDDASAWAPSDEEAEEDCPSTSFQRIESSTNSSGPSLLTAMIRASLTEQNRIECDNPDGFSEKTSPITLTDTNSLQQKEPFLAPAQASNIFVLKPNQVRMNIVRSELMPSLCQSMLRDRGQSALRCISTADGFLGTFRQRPSQFNNASDSVRDWSSHNFDNMAISRLGGRNSPVRMSYRQYQGGYVVAIKSPPLRYGSQPPCIYEKNIQMIHLRVSFESNEHQRCFTHALLI